jgi:hypothetical protein
MARHVAGGVGHRRHIGLGRRQHDAGRYGGQRHAHGQQAESHKTAMEQLLHDVSLSHSPDGDKVAAHAPSRTFDVEDSMNHYND